MVRRGTRRRRPAPAVADRLRAVPGTAPLPGRRDAGARLARPDAASTPWADAAALHISPQLRRTGSYERRGKPRKVEDRQQARRLLAESAAKQAAEIAAARARLATDGITTLSGLGELDPVSFRLFLQLLGDALATWRHGMTHTTATSNDGSMEIRLTALPDGPTTEIRTPVGTFRGPDR
ncbi:DUF2397 family protein [Streptomyces sp. NPDC047718]|uniref:DUF2397 family protein n=1 Tax=Streptomyces sp. NPDC047718 TaxID=3155479 RepID=UPI0033C6FDEF